MRGYCLHYIALCLIIMVFSPRAAESNSTDSVQPSANASNSDPASKLSRFAPKVGVELARNSRAVQIGNDSYEPYKLIDIFLQAVLSRTIPPSEFWNKVHGTVFDPPLYKERYPWLYEFFFRTEGVPRYFALNRWAMPLTVSVGLPNDARPFSFPERKVFPTKGMVLRAPYKQIPDSFEEAVRAEATAMEGRITASTGLPFAYIPHGKETIHEFARIRVVPVDDIAHWRTAYKNGGIVTGSNTHTLPFRFGGEFFFYTRVPFTRITNKHVDGFFLANAHNEIELSICYIWPGHSPPVLQFLIRECLLRSLGLPSAETIDMPPSMFLAPWNDPDIWNDSKKKELPSVPPDITELDWFLVRILYAPALQPGMHYEQIVHKLYGRY